MPDCTPATAPRRLSTTAVAGTVLAVALAGCADSAHAAAHTTTRGAGGPASSSAAPIPMSNPPGTRGTARTLAAATLAKRVPGCTPQPVRAGDSTAPGFARVPGVFTTAASAATCTLRGRTVVIFTFADQQQQARNEADLARVDAFFAAGNGWTAAPEDISEPVGQQSVVQGVALTLHGRIEFGSG